MANFTADSLQYRYNWKADGGDNPRYTGYLDQIRVDKTEGYEVLYFCNRFLETHNVTETLTNFRRVETLLKSTPASLIILRTELYGFIESNWNNPRL